MSRFEELERLAKMLDEEKITSEEYARLKEEILAEESKPKNAMEGKPAGWYSDPTGQQSHQAYWDGSKWSGATRKPPRDTPRAPLDAKPIWQRKGVWLVLAIIVLIVVANLTSGSSPTSGGGGQSSGHEAVEAYVVCQQFVEDSLKAPSTAEFGGPYSQVTTHLGGGKYVVETYVDSQNSFGAMVRADFSCTVQHQSGDTYRLVSLNIDE